MSAQADAYELGIDFDRDHFFCTNVQTTEPLNIIPRAASMAYFNYVPIAGGGISLLDLPTNYGLKAFAVAMPALNDGARIVPSFVPLLGENQYFFVCWMRTISSSGDTVVTIDAYDNGIKIATGATPSLTSDFQRVAFNFTVNSLATTTPRFDFYKRNAGGSMTVEIAGIMVTPFSALGVPAAFNTGAVSNAYENIWSYVENVDCSYGCTQYSDAFAPPSQMTITVNNSGGEFLPDVGVIGQYLSKGALVRLRALIGTTYYDLFIGTLDQVRYDPGTSGARRAYITVTDAMPQLLSALYAPKLQQNVTTDQVLQEVFDSLALVYPYPGDFWILDAPGYCELGENTFLVEQDLTNFETGATTFDFAGDITGAAASLNAQSVLREYTYGELGGRFFWDAPTGQFKFFNRNHDVNATASAMIIGAAELDEPPTYIYGDDIANRYTVNYYPRVTGAAASVVYPSATSAITLTSGKPYTFTARYQDPSSPTAQVAVVDPITPVKGLDYIANAASDGSGSDKTAFVGVSVNFLATSAVVTLINYDPATVYLTTFQLRGTPLTSYTRASVQTLDGQSIGMNGDRPRTVEITTLSDSVLAESYTNYLTQRYKTPIARIGSVSFWANRDAATLLNVLTVNVGDPIQIDDAFLQNTSNQYVVTALHHIITPIRSHWLGVTVEPLDRALYWILEDATLSILETTTRLGI